MLLASLSDLWDHCQRMKQWSSVQWVSPSEFAVEPRQGRLCLSLQGESKNMTDWSFSQLCSLAQVSKDTVRLSSGRRTAL
jgi:hypothetical protein